MFKLYLLLKLHVHCISPSNFFFIQKIWGIVVQGALILKLYKFGIR